MGTLSGYCRWALAVVAPLAWCGAGCVEAPWRDGLAWSPDGERAAFFEAGALYVMDATGKLSEPLGSGISGGAWLPDSERLALIRTRRVHDLREIEKIIGPERAQAAAARADLLATLLAQMPADELPEELNAVVGEDVSAMLMYLLERHADVVRQHSREEPTGDEALEVQSIVVGRLIKGRLEISEAVYEDLGTIGQVRVAANAQVLAFTHKPDPLQDSDNRSLLVCQVDRRGPAELIAESISGQFDWTPDGRAVVFFAESHLIETEVRLSGTELEVGEGTSLADVIVSPGARVRCLRDGRVVFNAQEYRFPSIETHTRRDQLFVLERTGDGSRLSALLPADLLERVPASLASFEMSPDGWQVILVADRGAFMLMGLADGHFERIAQPAGADVLRTPLPSWRRSGEFTWVRRTPGHEELLLRRSQVETVLSRTWPAARAQLLLGH